VGGVSNPDDIKPEASGDRVQVAVLNYTVSADVYAEYGADFDPEAVNDAVRSQINSELPSGIVVERNGMVMAAPEAAEQAAQMDWDAILAGVDLAQILATHPREQ
jgi:hypothetical protein